MSVLIVDDTEGVRLLFRRFLTKEGIENIRLAGSGVEAIEIVEKNRQDPTGLPIDLILMDLIMPGMDGIEVLKRIKSLDGCQDIPIIVITAVESVERLKEALDSGAVDYITKPANRVELLARCRSALRLKKEIDQRKEREKQLRHRNQMLERLSYLDGLTTIANRRYFDESFNQEWGRAAREQRPLGLIMIDIDLFKKYNDLYGHQVGDHCLAQVAKALVKSLKRPADFVARYGGEEFSALLPNTDEDGVRIVAEVMRSNVENLNIVHEDSGEVGRISISLGGGSMIPRPGRDQSFFLRRVDQALYAAKKEGRNRVAMIRQTL